MTRIFEALKKSQAGAAMPFPAAPQAPIHPIAGNRPGGLAPSAGHGEADLAPRLDSVATPALPDEVVREMSALRIGLESMFEERATRVVLFMSSVAGEGTTTVAAQFAILLASDPAVRPLLLDLNVRRPGVAACLGLAAPPETRGREPEVGRHAADRPSRPLSVAFLPDSAQGYDVPRPAAVRTLLSSLSMHHDWIVVDGPPVLGAPEAAELATVADGVVLVVRSGHTKRPVVARAAELLRKSGARVLGSVLNRRRLEIPDFIYRRI
jgi:Mrp family chromosome partitioning ATPase